MGSTGMLFPSLVMVDGLWAISTPNLFILNFTGHNIDIYNEDGTRFLYVQPSGLVLRASEKRDVVDEIDGIVFDRPEWGKYDEMPIIVREQQTVVYIVSALYAKAIIQGNGFIEGVRLTVPGRTARNASGEVKGCMGLSVIEREERE